MGILQNGIPKYSVDFYEHKLIDEPDADTTYIGWPEGTMTKTSEAKWCILRIKKTGNVTAFSFADGDYEYDNVWDNRASLTTYPTFA
jgi:hypothetical protein